MEQVRSLRDLNPRVCEQYRQMADQGKSREVKAFIFRLILSADADVDTVVTNIRYYGRAQNLINRCKINMRAYAINNNL